MTKRLMAVAVVLGLASQTFAQSGVSGSWITTDFGNMPITITLNASGTSLTGTITAQNDVPIFDGRVDGSTVTFKATGAGGARTVSYVGKLEGSRIAFTRTVTVRDAAANAGAGIFGANGPMQFTATRDDSSSAAPALRALVGNWVSNPQKGQSDGVQPAVARVPTHRRYMLRPDGSLGFVSMLVDGTGNMVIWVGSGQADGKDHPAHTPDTIMRLLEGDQNVRRPSIATRIIDDRTIEYTQKNPAGVITDVATLSAAPDGQTITETIKVMDPSGKQRGTRVIVFERQK